MRKGSLNQEGASLMGGPARDPVAELWCAVLTLDVILNMFIRN